MLRVGTVPYLNARPLVQGLESRPDVALLADVPSRLVLALRAGQLDAALVSAVELFRDPPLQWLDLAAITSAGPVRSILLFCRCAPAEVTSLALDRSSRSASVLAQVCLRSLLGAPVARVAETSPEARLADVDADAVLRIGDPALATDPGDRLVVDLGAVWTARTGLPFVYAAWLLPPGPPAPGLLDALRLARDEGLARRAVIASEFARSQGRDPAALADYLEHAIGYGLGPAEREGLGRFGRLARELGLVDHAALPAPLAARIAAR